MIRKTHYEVFFMDAIMESTGSGKVTDLISISAHYSSRNEQIPGGQHEFADDGQAEDWIEVYGKPGNRYTILKIHTT